MYDQADAYAKQRVSGPATALIVVSAISIPTLLVAMAFSLWLLLSGTARQMRQPEHMSKETEVSIRLVWNFLMQISNVAILTGAMSMKRLRSRRLAKLACSLALIPCLGPCYVVGIPFGIWGLNALNDANVQNAFERQ